MASTRMLVPSLGMAAAVYDPFGQDDVRNANVRELLRNLSALLWTDEVLIAEHAFDRAHTDPVFATDVDKECGRLLLDGLQSEGLLVTFDPKDELPEMTRDALAALVLREQDMHSVPVEDDHVNIDVGGCLWCAPRLAATYAAVAISDFHGAMPLLSDEQQRLWSSRVLGLGESEAVLRALEFFVPETRVEDYGLFCPERQSSTCGKVEECKPGAPGRALQLVETLLRLRDDRTIRDLCTSVRAVARDLGPDVSESRVVDAAYRDIMRAQSAVARRFADSPAQGSWASATMSVTVFAAALGGLATGHPVIGTATATTAQLLFALARTASQAATSKRDLRTLVTRSVDHKQLAEHMAVAARGGPA